MNLYTATSSFAESNTSITPSDSYHVFNLLIRCLNHQHSLFLLHDPRISWDLHSITRKIMNFSVGVVCLSWTFTEHKRVTGFTYTHIHAHIHTREFSVSSKHTSIWVLLLSSQASDTLWSETMTDQSIKVWELNCGNPYKWIGLSYFTTATSFPADMSTKNHNNTTKPQEIFWFPAMMMLLQRP